MEKINNTPVHLAIEGKTFEFEVEGEYFPQDDHHAEEFDLQHLYHLRKGDRYSTDYPGLLEFPSIWNEVVKQLKAIREDKGC